MAFPYAWLNNWPQLMPQGPDPGRTRGGTGKLYQQCQQCRFHCVADHEAYKHYEATGHQVRLAYRPARIRRRH